MADLVVKDLEDLVADLNELISQFQGALDLEHDDRKIWGQHNANLSMGDFADNWTVHRDEMVKQMETLRDMVQGVDDAWSDAEAELVKSLQEEEQK